MNERALKHETTPMVPLDPDVDNTWFLVDDLSVYHDEDIRALCTYLEDWTQRMTRDTPSGVSWLWTMESKLKKKDPDDEFGLLSEWYDFLEEWGIQPCLPSKPSNPTGKYYWQEGAARDDAVTQRILTVLVAIGKQVPSGFRPNPFYRRYKRAIRAALEVRRTRARMIVYRNAELKSAKVLSKPEAFSQYTQFISSVKIIHGDIRGITCE